MHQGGADDNPTKVTRILNRNSVQRVNTFDLVDLVSVNSSNENLSPHEANRS
jgi:hypothetical protein